MGALYGGLRRALLHAVLVTQECPRDLTGCRQATKSSVARDAGAPEPERSMGCQDGHKSQSPQIIRFLI